MRQRMPSLHAVAAPESTLGQAGGMPLIDVTYDGTVGEEVLRRLGELLPDVVGEAVECPEEPSTGRRSLVTWKSGSERSLRWTWATSMS